VEVELERSNGETEEEYLDRVEKAALEKADSGDIIWTYDGIVEPEEYCVGGH
jgi:hypothetical protein